MQRRKLRGLPVPEDDDNDNEPDQNDTVIDAEDEEEGVGDKQNRSMKLAFKAKLLSSVIDYAARYDLLQFQHDAYVYHIVTATKCISRRQKIGHSNALAGYHWIDKYWEWPFAGLRDIVDQYGTPDLCYTIAPYEFLFHWHQWIDDCKAKLGLNDLQLPTLESMHVLHVLRQLTVGYLLGKNGDKPTKWREHVLHDHTNPSNDKCLIIFYRLETQGDKEKSKRKSRDKDYHGRGAWHIHLVVWFKSLANLGIESQLYGNLDPHDDDPLLAAWASIVNESDKPSTATREQRTFLQWDANCNRFSVVAQYCANMAERTKIINNKVILKPLRLFFRSMMRVCTCHQDCTWVSHDSKEVALQRYLTLCGYVTKQDGKFGKHLKEHDSQWDTANRVLQNYKPFTSEMTADLCAVPLHWTNATTKKLKLFGINGRRESWELNQYRLREYYHETFPVWRNKEMFQVSAEDLTLKEWCRLFTRGRSSDDRDAPVRTEKSIVSVEIVMPPPQSDDFYGTWLIANHPHRDVLDLHHPRHTELPKDSIS